MTNFSTYYRGYTIEKRGNYYVIRGYPSPEFLTWVDVVQYIDKLLDSLTKNPINGSN